MTQDAAQTGGRAGESSVNRTLAGPRVLIVAPMTNWMFQNLVPPLRRLCSSVHAYVLGDHVNHWAIPHWPAVRRLLLDRFHADMRELIPAHNIDVVLNLHLDDTLDGRDITRLRDLGARVVTYHVDMAIQWYRALKQVRSLDLLAVAHMQNLEPMVRRGAPLHFMPMGASPDRYLRIAPERSDVNVTLLGSRSPNTEAVVGGCLDVTPDVNVYGPGWCDDAQRPAVRRRRFPDRLSKLIHDLHYAAPRLMAEGGRYRLNRNARPLPEAMRLRAGAAKMHGYAPSGAIPDLMSRSAVTLGVTQRLGNIGDRTGFADSRLRDFEVPLTGTCYLVQEYLDLHRFYVPGREVVTWRTLDELREKLAYLLEHETERRAIAAAGRTRAMLEHSWDTRLSSLFSRLGFRARECAEDDDHDDGDRARGGVSAGAIPSPLLVAATLSTAPWCGDSAGCAPTVTAPEPEFAAMKARR